MKLALGIDPGIEGYMVLLDMETRQIVDSSPLPHFPDKQFDVVTALAWIRGVLASNQATIIRACLEEVHAIYGASAKSTFQFGRGFGSLETFLASSGVAYKPVPPKTWQKSLWVGVKPITKAGKIDTKAMSLSVAYKLFPTEKFLRSPRCRVPDGNWVDASLIAYYACIS